MDDCTSIQLRELEKRIDQRFELEHNAVILAHAGMERRLDGMNEFRSALKDQAGTFITRKEFYTAIVAVTTIVLAALTVVLQTKAG